MLPRKRTCLTTGWPEAERCRACANPKNKAKCELSADNLADQAIESRPPQSAQERREEAHRPTTALQKSKEECEAAVRAAADLRRKTDAEKRQKTLHFFFNNPLQHDVRRRSTQEALGEGYTARNLTSGASPTYIVSRDGESIYLCMAAGTFANHVKAIETRIIEIAKDDPLAQLQLAAAVNQRLQGIRHLRDEDQEA
ncbi:MAG: hypothetical protein SGPRY_012188, partial [Prymnesium sp.]